MSKTKGNGLDPLDFIDGIDLEALVAKRTSNLTQPKMAQRIEKQTRKDFPDGIAAYGTDALRFTFAALATTGRDVRFDTNRIEGYRNFCNKLWNAAKFVLMNTEALDLSITPTPGPVDQWIVSKTHRMINDARFALDTYRFDIYATTVYEFAWHEYCDWYLELSKPLLWNDEADPAARAATQRTLLQVLEVLLRTAHPVMPFITETLWQQVAQRLGLINDSENASIMLQRFPESADMAENTSAEAQIEWLKAVITGIRTIRGEANIKPSQEIPLLLQGGSSADRKSAAQAENMLARLANVTSIQWLDDDAEPPLNALSLVGELKVMVPLAGLIDVEAERARIGKEVGKTQQELEKIEKKLGNEAFVAKAPEAVVAKERTRAEELHTTLSTLESQIQALVNA
jgi:valyl-tRNA synthetase